LAKSDPNFRPNTERAIYVQGEISRALVDALTPKIISIHAQSREPITVYIDSPGGSTLSAEAIRRLLKASDQDGAEACRIITVVTGRAASAAADLLSFGDYAVGYPGSTVFYHGVRYEVRDLLTIEKASAFAESLRLRNDLYAMTLAKRSVRRLMFRYAMSWNKLEDYRTRSGKPGMENLDCFLGVVGEHLSKAGSKTLAQADRRYRRYAFLVESSTDSLSEA
jgi:ATP-dependent protease ClpP protease subunit